MKDLAELVFFFMLIVVLMLVSAKGCSLTINDKVYKIKIGEAK